MYSVQVEYHTQDHRGNVHKRTERLVLAIQPGERVITIPKAVVIMPSAPSAVVSRQLHEYRAASELVSAPGPLSGGDV